MSITMSFLRLVIFVIGIISIFEGANGKPPSRIVGGEQGAAGEFPYMAGLLKRFQHVCGGAIIGKRYILTAAHCIDGYSKNPSREMSVVTGSNVIKLGSGKTHAIESIKIHPQYSNRVEDSWKNDIAVIILKDNLVFDALTQPIKLPEDEEPGNRKCVASGWGDMSYPNGQEPINIRKTSLTTMTNADCKAQAKGVYRILDSNVCAYGGFGVGVCVGDSGGPLVHNGTVVGIASFTVACARGVPDVFTRVYPYLDFIHQVIAGS